MVKKQKYTSLLYDKKMNDGFIVEAGEPLLVLTEPEENGVFQVRLEYGNNVFKYFWVNQTEVETIQEMEEEIDEIKVSNLNEDLKESWKSSKKM